MPTSDDDWLVVENVMTKEDWVELVDEEDDPEFEIAEEDNMELVDEVYVLEDDPRLREIEEVVVGEDRDCELDIKGIEELVLDRPREDVAVIVLEAELDGEFE